LIAVACAFPASAQSLAPYKDDLFAYPGILSSEGDAYRVVDYQEMRDINERDQVPERRVQGKYVSTGVRKVQQDLVLRLDAGDIRHFAVGKTEGAFTMWASKHRDVCPKRGPRGRRNAGE